MSDTDTQDPGVDASAGPEKQKLDLKVKVEQPQACLRHVIVTVPRADIDRYRTEAYNGLMPEAQVPGFRAGRAPRKLVEKAFKDRVSEQIKGSLLMDSLSQVTEEQDFSAISEPDFDFESIELPDSGDFTFEFTVEVRPEFDTPDWKGLKLSRPVEEIDDAAIDEALDRVLQRYSTSEPTDAPAEPGDTLLLTAKFSHNGKQLSLMDEERVVLRDELSFPDGSCPEFGKLLAGAKEGESRTGKVKLSESISNEELAGKEVDAEFHVVEVIRRHRPELTSSMLEELGDFENEQELRNFIRESLIRQQEYRQREALRKQITETLTASADWELPPDLVKRQTRRELERKVLELRRNGFPDDQIQSVVNLMRQNARSATEAALREHFILEKIAEDQKVDAEPKDYDDEIELIAEQSEVPARRVRARLEKSGQMDALRNQIVERKVIELITAAATVTDEPVDKDAQKTSSSAVSHPVATGHDEDLIPEAKYDDRGGEEEKLPGQGGTPRAEE